MAVKRLVLPLIPMTFLTQSPPLVKKLLALLGAIAAALIWIALVFGILMVFAFSSKGLEESVAEFRGGTILLVGFLGLFPVMIGTIIALERLFSRAERPPPRE
jgi:hypothetical protein